MSARALLESLGLLDQLPTPRLLDDLFVRFSAQVPYETLTKRPEDVDVDAVCLDLAEEGRGVGGSSRARVFHALAHELGLDVRLVRGEPYPAAIARVGGAEVLCDVALPLTTPIPLDAIEEIASPHGKLTLRRDGSRVTILFDAHGLVEPRRSFDLDDERPTEPERDAAPFVLRAYDDRIVRWSSGMLTITDSWSVLTHALAPGETEAVLGFDAGEEPAPEETSPAVLQVFDHCDAPLAALLARLGTPEGHLAMQPPGTRAEDVTSEPGAFSSTLVSESGATRRERVVLRPDGALIELVSGESPVASRRITLTASPDGVRLAMAVTLAKPVPPRGLAESVRKTLVYHLVSELMALADPGSSQNEMPTFV